MILFSDITVSFCLMHLHMFWVLATVVSCWSEVPPLIQKVSISKQHQCRVLLSRQWTVCFAQFTVHILLLLTHLQRGAAGLPTTAIPPSLLPSPCSMNTPCPGMKLTLACRHGAEISPNRRDKNPIPRAPMDGSGERATLGP